MRHPKSEAGNLKDSDSAEAYNPPSATTTLDKPEREDQAKRQLTRLSNGRFGSSSQAKKEIAPTTTIEMSVQPQIETINGKKVEPNSGKEVLKAAEQREADEELAEKEARQKNFNNHLKALIIAGKKNGGVSREQMEQMFEEFAFTDVQFEAILNYMINAGINMIQDTGRPENESDELENIYEELERIEAEESDDEDKDGNESGYIDGMTQYLKEIGAIRLLSAEEEVELAKAIELGMVADKLLKGATFEELAENENWQDACDILKQMDESGWEDMKARGDRAHDRMTTANLRLVVSQAKRYLGRGMELQDMIQEGNAGLMKAVNKFDYRRGFKFSTYAIWWIRQAISRAITDQSHTIRIPAHMMDRINKYKKTRRELIITIGREPTPVEIGNVMNLSAAKVEEVIKLSNDPVSLDAPISDDDDSFVEDLVPDMKMPTPADAADFSSMRDQLDEVLSHLTPREQGILRMRYGMDDGYARTLEEVGAAFHITRERIRQLEKEALGTLRAAQYAQQMRVYL